MGQRVWHLIKEDTWMLSKHMKRCSISRHQGNANYANLNNEIPLYTYKHCQDSEHWQHWMLVSMRCTRNPPSLPMGLQNGTSTLEDSLAVSCKIKHILTLWPSNHIPWYLCKGVENLCSHKTLHMDVYSSSTCKCQNLEATKISFSK